MNNSHLIKRILAFSILFLSFSSHAQVENFEGHWVFDKMGEEKELDEIGKMMLDSIFSKMTITIVDNKIETYFFEKTDQGTIKHKEGDIYSVESIHGENYTISLSKVGKNKIIYSMSRMVVQMKKSKLEAKIELQKGPLDLVKGLVIDKSMLCKKWFHNGMIKDGVDKGIILKHNEKERVSYTFEENGNFTNRMIFESTIEGTWSAEDDGKILLITTEDFGDKFKVIKLTDSELHLVKGTTGDTLKFVLEY